MIRENPGGNRRGRSGTRMARQKNDLRKGQQAAREEMLEDVGVA